MNDDETRIYKYYRRALHNQRNNRWAHAPEKRQNARAKVVAEFDIPYAEVKRIVREGDLLNGITHEKPVEGGRYAGMDVRAVPLAEVRVGDRVISFTIGTDARVIAIDGYRYTLRGLRSDHDREAVTFTQTYDPADWGADWKLLVVVNTTRRVPAAAR